jgi:hypothetical protein
MCWRRKPMPTASFNYKRLVFIYRRCSICIAVLVNGPKGGNPVTSKSAITMSLTTQPTLQTLFPFFSFFFAISNMTSIITRYGNECLFSIS